MTTIRKSEPTASSSSQRSAPKPEAARPANKLENTPAAPATGHPGVSSFTPARARPLVALQPEAPAQANRTALSAQAQESGAPAPERLRTTDHLNLRTVPSTENNTPLTTLPPGAQLEVTPDADGVTRKDGFVHVAWNKDGVEQKGWVAERFTTPVLPPGQQELGSLSQRYESNGNPGAVSSGVGDPGGVSYGAYQFATTPGSAQKFVDWLADNHPEYHAALSGKTPGSEEFSTAWKELAAQDPQGFLKAQHDHIQSKFFDPARADVARSLGMDVGTRSQALQDVLWSTAVQHGPGGALKVFERALDGKDVSQLSDEDIIRAVYAERGRKNEDGTLVYFSKSSAAVQQSVAQRFINEERDALAMLEASKGE